MKDWKSGTSCPVCGGVIFISEYYNFSRDYQVTRKGILSKRYTKTQPGPMEVVTACCKDCGEYWDADGVIVESSGEVFLKVEAMVEQREDRR